MIRILTFLFLTGSAAYGFDQSHAGLDALLTLSRGHDLLARAFEEYAISAD